MIKYGFFNASNHDKGPYPVKDFLTILKEFLTEGVFKQLARSSKTSQGYYVTDVFSTGFSMSTSEASKFAIISPARAWLGEGFVDVDSQALIYYPEDELKDIGNIPGSYKKAYVMVFLDSTNRACGTTLIFGDISYNENTSEPVIPDNGIKYNKIGEVTFYNKPDTYGANFKYILSSWAMNRDYIDNPDKFFVCYNPNFMDLSGYFKQYDIMLKTLLKATIPTAISSYDREMKEILDADAEEVDEFISDETTEVNAWASSISPSILTPAQIQQFTADLEDIQTNYLLKSDVVKTRTALSPEDTTRVPASSVLWDVFGPIPYPDEP